MKSSLSSFLVEVQFSESEGQKKPSPGQRSTSSIVNEVFVPLNDRTDPRPRPMGAAETKAGHEEEYVDGTSAAPWPQLDRVRPTTSPSLVDDGTGEEDGEGRGGANCEVRHLYWNIAALLL